MPVVVLFDHANATMEALGDAFLGLDDHSRPFGAGPFNLGDFDVDPPEDVCPGVGEYEVDGLYPVDAKNVYP